MKKRIGILTGGGDVQALNVVIASAQDAANSLKIELLGIIKGWEGILKNNYINSSALSFNADIGGTFLKSSRVNLAKIKNGTEIVLENLKMNKIAGLIVLGGNDTLSNSFLIKYIPQILITKTIDNDVGKIGIIDQKLILENIVNYFTLGFPTAASKICSFVSMKEGLRTTAYSHERIIIVESMGMHTGWLAIASGMAHPDFILIPEFPLNYEFFLEKVIKKYEYQKHLIIVVAEGTKWQDGSYVYAKKDENEDFGHPRFGGAANALTFQLKKDIEKYFPTRNINAVNPSYLYRAGAPNELDQFWAKRLGETAVKYLAENINGTNLLAIQKDKSGFKIQCFPVSEFDAIDKWHRSVDERFYKPEEFHITENGKDYLREIIEEIPFDKAYGIK